MYVSKFFYTPSIKKSYSPSDWLLKNRIWQKSASTSSKARLEKVIGILTDSLPGTCTSRAPSCCVIRLTTLKLPYWRDRMERPQEKERNAEELQTFLSQSICIFPDNSQHHHHTCEWAAFRWLQPSFQATVIEQRQADPAESCPNCTYVRKWNIDIVLSYQFGGWFDT